MGKYKDEKLSDETPLNVAVYRAYRKAGLSYNQAVAITAEVGRENGFQDKYIFGYHEDPASKKNGNPIVNIGMISWNEGRGRALKSLLSQRGLLLKNGKLRRSQATIDEQARFSVGEMKSRKYREKLKHFWNNPDADPESFARELGKNYIVWAYGQNSIRSNGGRKAFNWKAHDERRRGYLGTLRKMIGKEKDYQPSALFYGDSIAHGYRKANKAHGLTKVGANPQIVLNQLNYELKKNPEAFLGKNVVLSSGLSNNVNDYSNIEKQLQLLQSAGANVHLLGVSNQFFLHDQNGSDMNSKLLQLADQYKAKFNGGFNAGKDGVHPSSYQDLQLAFNNQTQALQDYKPPVKQDWNEFVKSQTAVRAELHQNWEAFAKRFDDNVPAQSAKYITRPNASYMNNDTQAQLSPALRAPVKQGWDEFVRLQNR